MPSGNELNEESKTDLLNIFIEKADQKGTDILAMSDFFNVFIGKIEMEMRQDSGWKKVINTDGLLGQIAAAIKYGFDISQTEMLVADRSHFSKEIVDGLKSHLYHIGQSKEIAGNLRPAILDEKEQLVKFFTLKKAIDPSNVLSDISMLSMQTALQKLSTQLKDLCGDVKEIIKFERKQFLSNPFLFARDKIMFAATANAESCAKYLDEADTYLMQGLSALYEDINAKAHELAEIKVATASLKTVDSILSYINEDMQMIPRYVGLRVYLLNYRGKAKEANRVMDDYSFLLHALAEEPLGKYTAFQLIHKYYPYGKNNIDFWLEKPKQMIKVTDTYKILLEQKNKEIYYIDSGENNNDNK